MISNSSPTSRIDLPPAPLEQREILEAGGVACWSEAVAIDTYEPGAPDRYPLFLDRRVYQGSSGRIYPLPMVDSVAHGKKPKLWQAIHLENAYVRLMLLPEIGGRIHIGYDKVAGYDFFYRNNVIKPALVGLAGPWISGGVEFNWPQHHRPATFLPVDVRIEREEDGSVVVWHSDLDPLQRMRGTHGIRLRPGSSVVEAEVELHNRTDTVQTFLWWANVAAASHENYQSFFPDDVAYVADHARRAITAFPRADRPYYGVDYPALAAEQPGADRIDVYSNIPVPTSYMITDTDDAFFGGYDHAADAGFVHWADRAVSPGKKQWTWGTGEIGRAWDAQLTDDDGPYVELMAGVFTDNQPDFAWLIPGETKRFSQFWFPIHAIGPARQATTDAAVSVDHEMNRVGILTTRLHADAVIDVETHDGRVVTLVETLGPAAAFVREFPEFGDARIAGVTVRAARSEPALIRWREKSQPAVEPWVATAPPQPGEIGSNDELFITATHLMQYRHPTREAVPYLQEALNRDPGDARAATALGAWQLQRGKYGEAAQLLQRGLQRRTSRNLNPRDGETSYLLGLTRERQGDLTDADHHLGRAAWNAVWAAPANLARARIALRQGRSVDALRLAELAGDIPEAERVAVLALLQTGRVADATARLQALAIVAPLDAATSGLARVVGIDTVSADLIPVDPRTVLDIGAEFARCGAYTEALAITESVVADAPAAFGASEPLRRLLRAAWKLRSGDAPGAASECDALADTDLSLAFPAGLDQYDALTLLAEPESPAVLALRGMWLLDAGRDSDALSDLRAATAAGANDPVAWRNLALALVRTGGSLDEADTAYSRALEISADPRLVFERDVLWRLAGYPTVDRLTRMEQYAPLLDARDDLALAHVTLLLDTDRVDGAWAILTGRTFRAFEGGEGLVLAAYDRAAAATARRLLRDGQATEAAALLRAGIVAPANLGEGRHPAVPQAERLVLLGDALDAGGDIVAARDAWKAARRATPLAVAPRAADFGDYWVGVAHLRLGEFDAAHAIWERLDARANVLDQGFGEADYFATSLPELLVFDTDTEGSRRAAAAALRAAAAAGRRAQTDAVRSDG